MNIARDKQIELTVSVVVPKACAVGPVAQGNSGFFGNIGERPIMIVVIETVLSEVLT